MKWKTIELIEGATDDEEAAFSSKAIAEHGVDSFTLSSILAKSLRPFAPLLKPGQGVALVIKPDGNAEIIGIAAEEDDG